MENRAHALVAGLFMLLLALALAGSAWWLAGRRESTREYLLVTQHSVNGLNVQAQVRYRGIRAGKVEDIDLDPRDPRNILVRISVDVDYPVTRATTARLDSMGVTGLAYVQLDDDGSSREPLAAPNGELPRIALKPSPYETLGDRAADAVARVDALATRLDALLDQRSMARLKQTLENLAEASQGLKDLPRITAALQETLSEQNLRRLQHLLANLEKASGEAAPLAGELRGVIASFKDLGRRFNRLTQETGGEFSETTLPRLNALLQDLQQNSRALNRVLENLEESPQAIFFGPVAPAPGPGERGYSPASK